MWEMNTQVTHDQPSKSHHHNETNWAPYMVNNKGRQVSVDGYGVTPTAFRNTWGDIYAGYSAVERMTRHVGTELLEKGYLEI